MVDLKVIGSVLKQLEEERGIPQEKIIEAIETLERVPGNYLKMLNGTNGLYEARIKLGSNIWRVFCFFDSGKLVILLNGFTKKSQKTPKNEIDKAMALMQKYNQTKNK